MLLKEVKKYKEEEKRGEEYNLKVVKEKQIHIPISACNSLKARSSSSSSLFISTLC